MKFDKTIEIKSINSYNKYDMTSTLLIAVAIVHSHMHILC